MHVTMSSSIRKLSSKVNEDDILCVGGRLHHSSLDRSHREPIIIPHKHVLATLITREAHNTAQLGREWVLRIFSTNCNKEGVQMMRYLQAFILSWVKTTHGRSSSGKSSL